MIKMDNFVVEFTTVHTYFGVYLNTRITNKLSIIINLTVTPMAEQSELIVNVLRVCIKFNRAKKFCSSSIPNNVLDKKLPLTTITT